MTNALQFADPLYLLYAKIWVGLLAVGGLILGGLRLAVGPNHPVVGSALVTYRSWWIILPLMAVPLGLGRGATIAAVTLLSLLCFKEFARATGLYRDFIFTLAVYASILFLNTMAWIRWYGMFLVWPIYVTALMWMIPVLRNKAEGMIQKASLSIVGFLYLGWFLGHLSYFTNADGGLRYLLFLTLAVSLNDIAAYTAGRLFGRTPLAPNVSPRKTWEGSIGCIVASAVVVWLLCSTFPAFGAFQKILAALIVGVGGQFGDLVVSVIKRDLGIKDMGAVFPGHGGLLDRFDSLIFVSPLFFHMVAYFAHIR
jgi:phosphatidate cytidylyltransferase